MIRIAPLPAAKPVVNLPPLVARRTAGRTPASRFLRGLTPRKGLQNEPQKGSKG